ncbi:MAG: hypothetical protein AB7S77_23395 [Desulfatirhabdiaceae bacterium]
MAQAGIDVENPKELDFTTDTPKPMPYHSAKVLTFDSIILPRFIKTAFGKMSPARLNHVVFVGITRAKNWVAMISTGDESFEPIARILPGEKSDYLTVLRKNEHPEIPEPVTSQTDSSDGILDIL